MRYLMLIASCGVVVGLVGCTSTYHPEYHPVTVTQVSQDLAYPVTVNNGGAPEQRSPIVIAPPAVQPLVIQPPPPPTPPPGWPNN